MVNEKEPGEQDGGLGLMDVYYIVFRHKWKIIFCAMAGLLGAAGVYLINPKLYQSEAKLMVKYVQENKTVAPVKDYAQIQSPDEGGSTIINSEVEILSSMDLALQTADEVGPEKVLAKAGGGNDRIVAAILIRKNLTVDAPNRGKILRIVLQHPDPAMVQVILRQVIETYKKKHLEIHRPFGPLDNWLTRETDRLRSELTQTDEELRKWKSKLGVISLDETKKSYIEEMSRIRQEVFASEAELQAHKATLAEAEKLAPSQSPTASTELGVPLKTINDYKNICSDLNSFTAKEQDLRHQYTESNSLMQQIHAQIVEIEKLKKKMEEENPRLASLNLAYAIPAAGTNGLAMDWAGEMYRTKALEAKIQAMKSQLASIRSEADKLEESESAITQLERKKELAETNYRYFSGSMEQARIDETLGAGKITNIPVIQEPSPPLRAHSKMLKMLIMIVLGGIGSGVGLAFFIELLLDQSVKRAPELGTKLPLPLMMAIPDLCRNGRFHWGASRKSGQKNRVKGEPVISPTQAGSENPSLEVAPWDAQHGLRPYHEALRDRLITYFRVRNMTHKPKLVALTSCSKGAGVTTLATGLAAALSETGEGNVLLVDMGLEHGAAHPFYKGKPGCGLSEAFEAEKRNEALIQENLYMVSAQNGNEQLAHFLPKKFTHLVPKMKDSDYDYIIFDLPPVSQTSLTAALASFMDVMLVVVEGEKTNRGVVKQAVSLLTESKANVSGVFNKSHTYVPSWLHQEL